MSEKDKHTLTGWLLGVATTAALAVAGWALLNGICTSETTAVLKARQELNFKEHDTLEHGVTTLKDENEKQHVEIKTDIKEIKSDIKMLLARKAVP